MGNLNGVPRLASRVLLLCSWLSLTARLVFAWQSLMLNRQLLTNSSCNVHLSALEIIFSGRRLLLYQHTLVCPR